MSNGERRLERLAHKQRGKRPARRAFHFLFLSVFVASTLAAQTPTFPDVTAISIEDLMNLKVTSVSKRAQKLADAPAAIFVITQEDIRRSGALNIPEALRMVPGVEVARIDENKWAIGSRGFNGRFANKLLVLIDGRTVYTPLFSGVYWNVQDVLLEDVDRIEVIRGPGATLWGANAVNGVINVITKSAQATNSNLLTAEVGTQDRAAGGVRTGGKIGSNTYYRAYSKYFTWGSSTDAAGIKANDGWDATRGGFRMDSTPSLSDTVTLQGDIYRSKYGETLTTPSLAAPYTSTFRNNGNFSGGNVLGRWNHSFTRSTTSMQMYYDKTKTAADSLLVDHQGIFDLDFQHDLRAGEMQELVWGLGYRATQDRIDPTAAVTLDPDHRSLNLFSAFVQDEVSLFDKRLRITLGSKFEHNDFTGFEVEPNARLLWNASSKHSVWGAISRAVRTPARTEEDMRLSAGVMPPSEATGGLPVLVAVFGNKEFKSENLVAYETGYRFQPSTTFSADIATFYNSYDNLLSAEPGPSSVAFSPVVHVVAPFVAGNNMHGGTYGVETLGDWKVLPKWKLSGSYTFLKMNIERKKESLDYSSADPAGANPSHQFYVRSSIDLPKNLENDVTVRYVARLSGLGIPSYYSLDAHFGWKPVTSLEFSLGGHNLLDKRHLEFVPDFINTTPTQVKRTLSATVTWKF